MDLICYLHPGWEPYIRPAAQNRDWMDASPETFAYRCLPLNIANAHGWEILCPVGFIARWKGGMAVGDIEILVDDGAPAHQRPVSIFGQAVLTFHVEGIFRTPPGWNLWVMGSPNRFKDGIAPLSGIIETDWSPYTFTMNWRFTRPNHWVRFEKGEPFAFVVPQERGALERFQPRLAPMAEEPGLSERYQEWSRSRNAFQAKVAADPPKRPADQWQKLYFKGLEPDGSPGAAEHQTKMRLAPFRAPGETKPK